MPSCDYSRDSSGTYTSSVRFSSSCIGACNRDHRQLSLVVPKDGVQPINAEWSVAWMCFGLRCVSCSTAGKQRSLTPRPCTRFA
eukprot:7105-Heterococcus_DN1.PRE.1